MNSDFESYRYGNGYERNDYYDRDDGFGNGYGMTEAMDVQNFGDDLDATNLFPDDAPNSRMQEEKDDDMFDHRETNTLPENMDEDEGLTAPDGDFLFMDDKRSDDDKRRDIRDDRRMDLFSDNKDRDYPNDGWALVDDEHEPDSGEPRLPTANIRRSGGLRRRPRGQRNDTKTPFEMAGLGGSNLREFESKRQNLYSDSSRFDRRSNQYRTPTKTSTTKLSLSDLENVGTFRYWFQSVRNFQYAAIFIWHTAILFILTAFSLLNVTWIMNVISDIVFAFTSFSPSAVISTIYGYWFSRVKFVTLCMFLCSQWFPLITNISQFRLIVKSMSLCDSLCNRLISTRTWMYFVSILASGSVGSLSYLRLGDNVHGDYGSTLGTTSRNDRVAVWTGVTILSTLYAFYTIVMYDKAVQFPSIPRKRELQLKAIVPTCISFASFWSLTFSGFWYSSCALFGPDAVIGITLSAVYGIVNGILAWMYENLIPEFISSYLPAFPRLGNADLNRAWETQDSISLWTTYTLFSVGFILLASWELAREVVWMILTERVRFNVPDLLVAISDEKNEHSQHLGFCYLNTIAEHLPNQRKNIYKLNKKKQWSPWRQVSLAIINVFERMGEHIYALQLPRRQNTWYPYFNAVSKRSLANAYSQEAQLCAWAAQAGSFFAVKALKEDDDGEVNKTVLEILNAMLGLSIALREYIQSKDPLVFIGSQQRVVNLHGKQLARAQWVFLGTQLDKAIYRITAGYYKYLDNFGFPREHIEYLNRYLTF